MARDRTSAEPLRCPSAREAAALPVPCEVLLALLPGVLTVYLAMRNGGFFAGTAALAATELALCIAAVVGIARRPFGGVGLPVAAATAFLGGLAAWTLLSSGWSDAPARATLEYTRVLLYALTVVLFGLLPYSVRRIRWMVYGIAAACVAVCAMALVARTLPEVIFDPTLIEQDRLGYPLGYWNSLGLIAGIGIVLCGHVASCLRPPPLARVVAASVVPLLTAVLYYTFSRGATWTTIAAVGVYLVVARPRAALTAAIATVPPTLVVLLTINPTNALTDPQWTPHAVSAGQRAILVIVLSCVAAGALRTALLPMDRRLARLRLPDRLKPVLVAALLVLALGGAAAADLPGIAEAKYQELTADDDGVGSYAGSSRFLSAESNGRRDHWQVALDAFRDDPLRGTGAGTYSIAWARARADTVSVNDAHSFYLELLAELGWPGLLLGVGAVVLVLAAFASRAHGLDRPLFAALLAAGSAWALHAGVDWDWEMPGVTLWLFALGGAALARSSAPRSAKPSSGIAVRCGVVAVCLGLAVLPARVAVSQARIDAGLDALEMGDCSAARSEVTASLSWIDSRALPYHVSGFCRLQEGSPRAAVAALSEAVDRDPYNWELRYVRAVARAVAGLDPRPELLRARSLNPKEELTKEAAAAFRDNGKRGWRRVGRALEITLPGPPTP